MLKKYIYYITHWETWHWFIKYLPILPFWVWHCFKSRSFWFFTASNPTLMFGGFLGETKREMYKQLPPNSYPKSIFIKPSMTFYQVQQLLETSELNFPLAVKPDIGMMGFMFRKVENEQQLLEYHKVMLTDYIIQRFIDYPLEVSVFYYRFPGDEKGKITGFLKKEPMQVTGNGKNTLWELILKYPRTAYRLQEMRAKHKQRLNEIIPEGQVFGLSEALNLSRGGRLKSLVDQKDENLLQMFDDLSYSSGGFYYGRYDIKCLSINDLKKAKNFSILEYNGSGAEPHHIYGDGNTLYRACKILLDHWKVLYKISRINHKKGFKYWPYKEGLKFINQAKKHFKSLKKLDAEFEFQTFTCQATEPEPVLA